MKKSIIHECTNRDCEINLLTQISKKLSTRVFFVVLTCMAIPLAAWGWAVTTKHETRITIIEQQITGINEIADDIKAIKRAVEK